MKIYCLTLGCAKNRVDSECLAGALAAAGHELVPSAEDAECALVNTCGFIRPAVEESIAAILDLEELKKDKKLQKIGVVGCLVNRYGEDLPSEVPLVDFWARTEDWKFVLEQLKTPGDDARRRGTLPLSSKYSRYLKISEGCGNCCTYCAIPGIRGSLRSLPVEVIVKEAAQLAEEGARELCVVGQDLTVYGTDTDGRPRLIELLDALESSLPHDLWIRLLYLHPSRVDRALLERVAAGRQVLPYLDIPVQHGDPEILAAMNRGIAPETLRGIFRTAREINPDFALRTTCMVGFPGEKKRHFDNLKNFVSEVRFDRMGAFTFFPEEGTVAAALEGQVPERTKNRRLGELMRLQEEISFERQRCFIGRELKVLVEKIEREEGYAEGRSFREAPEVDGVIEIRNIREDLKEGDIITLRVAEAMPHDMTGEEI
ncbi:30S ribosomal protein S12 methylthiotransferase RimO [Cloacibacillus evryensis]|uniref:Ribosomal protein uS12 methylthiotransferase RimO n=2 Tax=Cloacibacillus evryensis TaxID=508460 RepID=A0AAW5KCV3_9BACT|nr:30S ribosomal protein S12 methylthiotransferase RimO [Cloacibacillus evryensis]MCQ4815638.1 30S ribosomal protein S12 methylthiotransferase RimO [Cloacibacillus evryensis]